MTMTPNVSQGYDLVSRLNLSLVHLTTFKPMVGWIGPTKKLDVSGTLFVSRIRRILSQYLLWAKYTLNSLHPSATNLEMF